MPSRSAIPPPAAPQRPELSALTPLALAALMPKDGRPSLARAKAVWRWLRDAGVPEAWPDALPEVGARAWSALKDSVRLPAVRVEERVASRDGTLKWRLDCGGKPVETVLIPSSARTEGSPPGLRSRAQGSPPGLRSHAQGSPPGLRSRATVCVSSQSGCSRYCDFCATARMPFSGQLSAGEMVAQVLLARQHARVPLSNVVFMGMGEPLDNLAAVTAAIEVLDQGLGIAPRHATVSTSGVLPGMQQLWRATSASLALSLHATTQELRDRLMPRVRRWPLAELLAWMREASREAGKARHFFIEYALLAGVNDSDADAERLVALLAGVRARVNLIPFNAALPEGSPPGLGPPYRRPSAERVRAFQARVMAGGLLAFVRETRGDDAMAACGQLAASAAQARTSPPP